MSNELRSSSFFFMMSGLKDFAGGIDIGGNKGEENMDELEAEQPN